VCQTQIILDSTDIWLCFTIKDESLFNKEHPPYFYIENIDRTFGWQVTQKKKGKVFNVLLEKPLPNELNINLMDYGNNKSFTGIEVYINKKKRKGGGNSLKDLSREKTTHHYIS